MEVQRAQSVLAPSVPAEDVCVYENLVRYFDVDVVYLMKFSQVNSKKLVLCSNLYHERV